MTTSRCSPVAAAGWRVDRGGTGGEGETGGETGGGGAPGDPVLAVVRVDPAEPVFAGHYPGFPIFPGVCVVECVHRTALAAPPPSPPPEGSPLPSPSPEGAPLPGAPLSGAPPAGLVLAAVESTRFLSPVFPHDELTIKLTWSPEGPQWRCAAEVRSARGRVAQVRLRYRTGGDWS
ncbi:MAG TPA: hypothetical protein VFB84_11915 [Micromonosporaceae bacterium]|nr:hypothetical protein [Micromonosporaceae bacterium]